MIKATQKMFILIATCTLAFMTMLQPAAAENFQYFYDKTNQLTKAVDSSGTVIEYIYDANGNPLEVRRSAPPISLLAIEPSAGYAGDVVTIKGHGFDPVAANNSVSFNGVATVVSAAATNTLSVTVPATATTGPVSVTVGTNTASSSAPFTLLQAPLITSITRNIAISGMHIPNFKVSGKNLNGATFSFEPYSNPSLITVNGITMATNGDALLDINIASEAIGGFTVVATKAAVSSSRFPEAANLLNVIHPNTSAMPHLTARLNTSYVPPGTPITITAAVKDGTGTPWANEHVQFAIQNAAAFNANLNGNQTIIDAYTDAAGLVSVVINDPYAEKVLVQVAMPYFSQAVAVHPNFGTHTLIATPAGQWQYDISAANGNCNTVWDIYGSPYFVQNTLVTISNGCRLQIDAGVVVKFRSGGIQVGAWPQYGGTLDVYGQPGAEVIFTSVNDNSVGGILPASTGNPKNTDWGSIFYNVNSLGSMQHTTSRYGSGLTFNSSPIINNLTIQDARGGITIAGSPTITDLTMINVPINAISITSGSPVINGGSISGLPVATTSYPWETVVSISGATTNVTMSNMNISGGWHNVRIIDGASATFTNITFDGAVNAAIMMATVGVVLVDSTNIITNTPAPYLFGDPNGWSKQATPLSILGVSINAVLGVGVANNVRLGGTLATGKIILGPNPLRTVNNSAWLLDQVTIPGQSHIKYP